MDTFIDSLMEAQVFTVLYTLWGYWQVPIKDEDRDKTTITSHHSTYRCTCMTFDLRNAPATLQRALDTTLSVVRWNTCLVNIDEIVTLSEINCQNAKDIHEVLILLRQAGVTVKLPKCIFS